MRHSELKETMASNVLLVLSVFALLPQFTLSDSHDQCYCLKSQLAGLRSVVHIEQVPVAGENVYLIAEQVGVIHKYKPGTPLSTYINVSSLVEIDPDGIFDQNGLLGFAAHPDFARNQMLYLYSVRRINNKNYVVISEIKGTAENGEKMLVLIEQEGQERKGGQLLFGLDGFLYAFTGDSLNADDTNSKARDGGELLGKALRLDVDKLTVADFKLQYYDIPTNNPNKQGWRPEVYAMGFRNPWRCSVDKGDSSGRIFCGDLGGQTSDEISIIKSGGDYGFPLKEGTTCMGNETLCNNIADEVLPIYSFNRSTGPIRAVILGPIYRGSEFTSLKRQLVFGDYTHGKLFSLEESIAADNTSQWMMHNLTECDSAKCGCNYKRNQLNYIHTFGTTYSGEVMIATSKSMKPGAAQTSLYLMTLPESQPEACGATSATLSTLLGLALVLFSILNYSNIE